MNYHLHRHGQNPDVIPLEELARRRQAGELTGAEMVWCEGMSQWEPLDKILGLGLQTPPSMPSGPPPLPKKRRHGPGPLVITSIILVALLAAAGFGFVIFKIVNRAKHQREFAANGDDYRKKEAMDAASRPVTLGTNTLTVAEVRERHRALRLGQAGHDAGGTPRPAYDPKILGLLTNWVDGPHRGKVQDAETLENLKDLLAAGLQPEDQEDVALTLLNGWATPFFGRNPEAVCNAAEGAGKSHQWLALVLRGETEIDKAWSARGGGYVNTVSQNGWNGFADHLAKARKHLTAAWELRPEVPLAASRMIYVSLGDSGITEMRLWFDRAVAAQIDYQPAWNHMRWGLRPRWYGDVDSMLAFGVTALKTHRFDTDVPRMLFDSVSEVESELNIMPGLHVYDQDDVWPHLKEMYEGYIAFVPEDQNKSGWRSTYAAVAYLAGHLDVARQQLEELKWKPHSWNLSGWQRDLSLMPAEVAALTGSLSNEIAKAETAFKQHKLGDSLQLYTPLADAEKADDLTRSFVSNRLTALNQQISYNQGQWVSLLPADASFSGWYIVKGDCKRLPDGSVEVSADENGHMLYSQMPTGWEFEAKGSFEIVSSSTKAFQAGLVLGLPNWDTTSWYGFRLRHNLTEMDAVRFSEGWSQNQVLSPATVNPTTNSFSLRLEGGKISATVNGTDVIHERKIPKNSRAPVGEFYVGLGAYNDDNETIIRYTDLQVRKIIHPKAQRRPSAAPQ